MHRSLGDFLTDLFQNAVEAGASLIRIEVRQDRSRLHLVLTDNGKGMTPEELRRAQDPFYTDGRKHPDRKVGLGLPLVIQTLEGTFGEFAMESRPGEGTKVSTVFNLEHWDTPPMGDWSVVFTQVMAWPGSHDVELVRAWGEGKDHGYQVSRQELREAVGSFEEVEALLLLKEYFRSQESMEDGK